jgi:hypothetical protein
MEDFNMKQAIEEFIAYSGMIIGETHHIIKNKL